MNKTSAISTAQSAQGLVEAAEILVQIQKEQSLSATPKRYARICVWASKKNAGRTLQGELITDRSSVENDIQEYSELQFSGSLKIWNTDFSDQMLKEMQGWGESIVVLSGRTNDAKTHNFGDMILWLTETQEQTSLDDIVKNSGCGVMLDPDKEGKLLYGLCCLLKDPFAYTNQITGNFTGINNPDIAAALDEAGYSYWFKATDKTWLRGFWLGGQQARSVYADRSIIYDVKNTLARCAAAGLAYTQDNLALIEARILQTLKENSFVENVIAVNVPRSQKTLDKVQGLVAGVEVRYAAVNEVRTVKIKLGGDL